MTYRCRISDHHGVITKRTLSGNSKADLKKSLEAEGYYVLSMMPKSSLRSIGRPDNKAVLELTQSLSLMIESGLTLKEAFDITATLYPKGKTGLLIEKLNEDLRKGNSFPEALDSQQELFSPLYRGMIRVGEQLGRLNQILPALTTWLEKRKGLNDRIAGAMIYPTLVLFLVFAGITALLVFFLPYMSDMMKVSGDSSLAGLEEAYHGARNLVILFVSLTVLLPLFLLITRALKRNSRSFNLWWDTSILSIPFIGKFILNRDMLSVNFALSVLTQCGVPMEEALVQGAGVMENSRLSKGFLDMQTQLLKGDSLSVLTEQEKIFPPEFSRWIRLGERIGKMEKVFNQLHTYYQKEMDKMINRILTLAEPAIILVLGVVLFLVILNIILPLLTMYGGI